MVLKETVLCIEAHSESVTVRNGYQYMQTNIPPEPHGRNRITAVSHDVFPALREKV